MVTELTWAKIMEFEALHPECQPTLTRFEGKQEELSFKAKCLVALGHERPFDRHDWYVQRCGTEVKYVIDYYGPSHGHGFHIDARPTGFIGWTDRFSLMCRRSFQFLSFFIGGRNK